MAKRTGSGDRFYYCQYDLSGDVGAVQTLRQSRAVQDVTGLNKDAMERLGVLPDAELSFTAFWNDSAGQSYPVLSTLPTTDVIATYGAGNTIGDAAASLNGKLTELAVTRGQDGSLALNIPVLANGGALDWGVQLAANQSLGGTASSVDQAASSAFGGVAYLHVTAVAGGTPVVAVQHSSDNSTFADLIAFTASSTATFERKATAAITTTVNRYVRANVTAGTATVVVNFARYPTAQR